VWSGKIAKPFPILEFGLGIDVTSMARKLIEVLLVRTEISTSFVCYPDFLGALEHSKFVLNIAFFVHHGNFLHPKKGIYRM
jgi:hypothetical protein